MSPEEVRAWVRVFRDAAAVGIGVFLAIYGVAVISPPNVQVIALGLGVTGVPMFLRLDWRDKDEK